MIKAIIFDLNGVFILGPYLSERYHKKFGLDEDEFLKALNKILKIARLPGADNVYSYFKPSLKKWGIKLSQREFYDFWFEAEKLNPEMIKLAKKLRKNFKIYILSNNFRERSRHYDKKYPKLKELFEKRYYSWQTGYKKDSPKAYKKLLRENNLKPEECIYFDDKDKMVELAKGLGIKSYKFKDIEGVKKILKKYGTIKGIY